MQREPEKHLKRPIDGAAQEEIASGGKLAPWSYGNGDKMHKSLSATSKHA